MPDTPVDVTAPTSALLDGGTFAAMTGAPMGAFLGGEITVDGSTISIAGVYGFATWVTGDNQVYTFMTRPVTGAECFDLFPDPDPSSGTGVHIVAEMITDPDNSDLHRVQLHALVNEAPPTLTDDRVLLGFVTIPAAEPDPANWIVVLAPDLYLFGRPLPIYSDRLAADVSEAAGVYTDLFCLGCDGTWMRGGRVYEWRFLVLYQGSSAGVTGVIFEPLATSGSILCVGTAVAPQNTVVEFGDGASVNLSGITPANHTYLVTLSGIVVQTSDGVLSLRFKRGGFGTAKVMAGSVGYAIPIA